MGLRRVPPVIVQPSHASAPSHAAAPVHPTAALAPPATPQADAGRTPSGGHHPHPPHGHPGHGHAHGPTPRPRRPNSAKSSKRKRKARGVAPGDEEDLELPEDDEHRGLAPVAAAGEGRDGGDDQGEGGGERSHHDRLERIASELEKAAAQAEADLGRLSGWTAGANLRLGLARHVAESCRVVAAWAPGDRAAQALLGSRLALLKAAHGKERLDDTGVDALVDYLIEHAASAAGRNPNLNLMLYPWLLSLKRRRTGSQREHAIAWIEAKLHGAKAVEAKG